MSRAALAEALAPRPCDLKTDDLLSPLHLMCDLRYPNLCCIKSNVLSFPSGPVQTLTMSASRNLSFVSQTRSGIP